VVKEETLWKIVIPTQLTPIDQLKSTVGLGDSISSTAFTFDCKK
jgi:ADP-dependent phosphofructokinase/glucokinase